MKATTYQLNQLLNYLIGSVAYSPPATWYLGLSTSLIAIDGAYTEPAGNGYDRVAITNDTTNWTTATLTNLIVSNKLAASFPVSTGSWGTIQSIFLADAASGDYVCYYSPATPAFTVGNDIIVSFPIGSITTTRT